MTADIEKEKVKLIFKKDGDKKGSLETVTIRTEELEGRQYLIHFEQRDGKTCVRGVIPIGEYIPADDAGWVPGCLFNPAIDQARAIFADYGLPDRRHHRRKRPQKTKFSILQGQARLL